MAGMAEGLPVDTEARLVAVGQAAGMAVRLVVSPLVVTEVRCKPEDTAVR